MNVVIADDQPKTCDGIQELIVEHFPELVISGVFEDGETLDKYLETTIPDLLITDICMPGTDGLEVCRKLRERSSSVQIILVTGYQYFEYARQAINFKAHTLLVKPFSNEELVNAIADAIYAEIKVIAKGYADAIEYGNMKSFIKKHALQISRFTETQLKIFLEETNRILDANLELTDIELENWDIALEHFSRNYNHRDPQRHIVQDAKNFIHVNYADPQLSVSIIADSLLISADHLSKIFNRLNEVKLLEYITQFRIMKAKELLTDTSACIEDVALSVGFSSSQYFCRSFKNETGLTPTQYRKRINDK